MSAYLDAALLSAHARKDRRALTRLYRAAANAAQDEGARGFFLTQAYVFALECGHPEAPILHAALKALGREA